MYSCTLKTYIMHVYITGDCPYEESYKIQYRQDVVHGYDGTVYFTTMISSISIFYRQREFKGHFNLTFPCELLLLIDIYVIFLAHLTQRKGWSRQLNCLIN